MLDQVLLGLINVLALRNNFLGVFRLKGVLLSQHALTDLLGRDIKEGQANLDLVELARSELPEILELVDIRQLSLGTVLLSVNDRDDLLNVEALDKVFGDNVRRTDDHVINVLAC